jgi:hypothetical protein
MIQADGARGDELAAFFFSAFIHALVEYVSFRGKAILLPQLFVVNERTLPRTDSNVL